jgi:hypothetical protein
MSCSKSYKEVYINGRFLLSTDSEFVHIIDIDRKKKVTIFQRTSCDITQNRVFDVEHFGYLGLQPSSQETMIQIRGYKDFSFLPHDINHKIEGQYNPALCVISCVPPDVTYRNLSLIQENDNINAFFEVQFPNNDFAIYYFNSYEVKNINTGEILLKNFNFGLTASTDTIRKINTNFQIENKMLPSLSDLEISYDIKLFCDQFEISQYGFTPIENFPNHPTSYLSAEGIIWGKNDNNEVAYNSDQIDFDGTAINYTSPSFTSNQGIKQQVGAVNKVGTPITLTAGFSLPRGQNNYIFDGWYKKWDFSFVTNNPILELEHGQIDENFAAIFRVNTWSLLILSDGGGDISSSSEENYNSGELRRIQFGNTSDLFVRARAWENFVFDRWEFTGPSGTSNQSIMQIESDSLVDRQFTAYFRQLLEYNIHVFITLDNSVYTGTELQVRPLSPNFGDYAINHTRSLQEGIIYGYQVDDIFNDYDFIGWFDTLDNSLINIEFAFESVMTSRPLNVEARFISYPDLGEEPGLGGGEPEFTVTNFGASLTPVNGGTVDDHYEYFISLAEPANRELNFNFEFDLAKDGVLQRSILVSGIIPLGQSQSLYLGEYVPETETPGSFYLEKFRNLQIG